MTNVKLLPRFYKLVPFGGLLATIIALSLQTMSSLLLATLIFGVSIYFFRVGTATIGQIITDKDLIAESIILGDVFTRFVNFVVGIGFFFIIKFLDYKIVVILISILGTIGNVLFVDQPIKAYSDLIKSRGSL
ncbi:hypothetical protein [Bombilactobacillus thymidiniphilus]|uniref:Uncharacterized protein n=1 Tax=Bombilactobacillus thymidiniphilus TaxID=2923363 RepID=A0ABY4PDR7_9LACO|nr:hypothetical protein [Bombilactobacillus thymidiniphilus]UQS83601.1 hypothetical protein MOO47_07510 [Bombilactobacillus thymidiniphilus]UQS83646.1 hypothetical protein MOO47_00120 [Bombilactobacillus thymidiniphilus]